MDLNFIVFPKPEFKAQPEEFYSNIILIPKQVLPVKTLQATRIGMGSNRASKATLSGNHHREPVHGSGKGYFLPLTTELRADDEQRAFVLPVSGVSNRIGIAKSSAVYYGESKLSRKSKTAGTSKIPERTLLGYNNTLEFDDLAQHVQPIPLMERLVRIPSRRNDTPSSIQITPELLLDGQKTAVDLEDNFLKEMVFSQPSDRHLKNSDSMRRMLQRFNNKPVVVRRGGIPPGPKLLSSSKLATDENDLNPDISLTGIALRDKIQHSKNTPNFQKFICEMEGFKKLKVDPSSARAYVDFANHLPPKMMMTEPVEQTKLPRDSLHEASGLLDAPDECVSNHRCKIGIRDEKSDPSTIGPIGETNLKTLLNRKSLNELNKMYQSKKSIDAQTITEGSSSGPKLKLSTRLQKTTFTQVKPRLASPGPSFKAISTPNRQLSGERSGSGLASKLLLKGTTDSPTHPKVNSTLAQPAQAFIGLSPKPLRLPVSQSNQFQSPSRRVPSRPFLRAALSKPSAPSNNQSILKPGSELDSSELPSPEEKMLTYNHLARLKKHTVQEHPPSKSVSPERLVVTPLWRDPDTRKATIAKMMLQSDTNELDSIPCLLIPPPNVSDTLLVYFHANGEDLVQCQWFCERLAFELHVSFR